MIMHRFLTTFASDGVATFDFTAGGLIPAANCVQAFDPYIVQDLAQSYVDLSGHGNNAIATVPPTLGPGGWLFNGTDQFVSTGITALYNWSMFATYTYTGATGIYALFGANGYMYFYPWAFSATTSYFYYRTKFGAVTPQITSGVAGMTGEETSTGRYGKSYHNGVLKNTLGDTPHAGAIHYIGAMNNGSGSPYRFANCTVARWALYNISLSEAQAAALSVVMAV